jgi:hypothetical protein
LSGSINVEIDVQSGDKPAVLRLSAQSGSVFVRFTQKGGFMKKRIFPEAVRARVIQSTVSTMSGSVSGDIVHGNGGWTRISTHSGSINLDVYTYGVSEHDQVSRLSTASNHGSQTLRVISDIASSEAVRAIEAKHEITGSGSINISYPNEWEGTVHVTTFGYGSSSASGHGLVVRKESSHELYGYRGETQGRTVEVVEQGSGSVRFTC